MTVGQELCEDQRMAYDAKRLAELGRRNRKLKTDAEKLRAEIVPEIIAANLAGVLQKHIAELSGYTRESIRQICMTDEERTAELQKRRTRVSKTPGKEQP
jgi:hypothetical protein